PGLWNDPEKAKKITQEATRLRRVIHQFDSLEDDVTGLEELFEMASDEEAQELESERERVERELDDLFRETLFSGKHDDRPAIITITPGAGGTESSDWAGMLLRMYRRFAERGGYEVELLD